LDADTANEVDDLYTIVRAFAEPSWQIQALNATQWQTSQWVTDQTMEDSHRLNLVLAAYLQPEGTELLRGGYRRMYDWGDKAQHSVAAYNIIEQARERPEGEKLIVVALGALSNVASAVYIEPEIADKTVLYWLGTTFDFGKIDPGERTLIP
jgi:inosine-uridine nucleoside N-ribohydrolase